MKRIFAAFCALALTVLFSLSAAALTYDADLPYEEGIDQVSSYLNIPHPGIPREEYERQGIAPHSNYYILRDLLDFLGEGYGGRYFDEDDNCFVLIAGDNYDELAAQFAAKFPGFIPQPAKYPYTELYRVFSRLGNHMSDKTPYTIASVGIDQKGNRVIVEVLGLTDEIEQHIRKNVVDFPALTFVNVDSLPQPDDEADLAESTPDRDLP